jgi:hypothetical protein
VATRRFHAASHLIFLSMVFTVGAQWVLLDDRDGRYLLPLVAPLVMLAGVEMTDLARRSGRVAAIARAAVVAVAAAGALSMWEYRHYNYLWPNPPAHLREATRIRMVLDYLRANGVHDVFSMNGLLDPQLMFYSDERVLARWTSSTSRYPEYSDKVNKALATGHTVAVVGYTDDSGAPGCWINHACTGGIDHLVPNPPAIFVVDHKYFVYVGATRGLLGQLQFKFPE